MGMIWIVIGALLFIFVLSFLFRNQSAVFLLEIVRDKIFFVMLFAILLFVGVSSFHIYSNYNVNLSTYDGIINAGQIYFLWMKSIFSNLVGITGNVVGRDWMLSNSTG